MTQKDRQILASMFWFLCTSMLFLLARTALDDAQVVQLKQATMEILCSVREWENGQ